MRKIGIEIKLNKGTDLKSLDGMQLAEFEIKINNVEIPHYFRCIVFTPDDKVKEERIIAYIVIASLQNVKYADYFYDELKSLNLTKEEKEFVDNYTDTDTDADLGHKVARASAIIEKYFNVSAIDNLATIKRI